MIDTGGTIVAAPPSCSSTAAPTEVWIAATHGVLSGPAVDRLKNAPDPRGRRHQHAADPRREALRPLTVLSIAPIVAEALDAVFEDTSVSEIFRGDNV